VDRISDANIIFGHAQPEKRKEKRLENRYRRTNPDIWAQEKIQREKVKGAGRQK
jgi:hypothetical protein